MSCRVSSRLAADPSVVRGSAADSRVIGAASERSIQGTTSSASAHAAAPAAIQRLFIIEGPLLTDPGSAGTRIPLSVSDVELGLSILFTGRSPEHIQPV